MDFNELVVDYRGLKSFVAEAKQEWGEEAFQECLAGWVAQLKTEKENAETTNGKTYHTGQVADAMIKQVNDMSDKTEVEKIVAAAMITVAYMELEPLTALMLEDSLSKGGAA